MWILNGSWQWGHVGGFVLQGTALAPSKSIMLCLMKEMKWLYFYFLSGCVMWCCVSASETCCLGMSPEWSVGLKASSLEKIMLSLIGHCFGIKTWHPLQHHMCPVDCSLATFSYLLQMLPFYRRKRDYFVVAGRRQKGKWKTAEQAHKEVCTSQAGTYKLYNYTPWKMIK